MFIFLDYHVKINLLTFISCVYWSEIDFLKNLYYYLYLFIYIFEIYEEWHWVYELIIIGMTSFWFMNNNIIDKYSFAFVIQVSLQCKFFLFFLLENMYYVASKEQAKWKSKICNIFYVESLIQNKNMIPDSSIF